MSDILFGHFQTLWLVLAVICFSWIIWRAFKPSAQKQMDDNASIPLREND